MLWSLQPWTIARNSLESTTSGRTVLNAAERGFAI
jgi:hypothetical protein